MTGRRFRIRTIGPKLRQNPGIITTRYDIRFISLASDRIQSMTCPDITTFNYIIKNYVESNKLDEARIWREKTNMRLENPEIAIKNLRRLLKFRQLKDREYAETHAILAQSHLMLNAPDTALQELKMAQAYTKNKAKKGRYFFIMGQLYNQLGFKDSANYAFDAVIALKRKSPRDYMINAHLQKIQNITVTPDNQEDMLEYLTDLEENRENRPFLSKIFHQVANYHLETGSDSLALVYYNKSLKATTQDQKLKAENYETLGEYFFNQKQYKNAGAYYDSTLTNLAENTKRYRRIKKKFDNLEEVIKYEEQVRYADSIISIYKMPEAERIAFFNNYIEKLKEEAEKLLTSKEKKINAGYATFAKSKGGKENKGKYYFYNITSLGYGRNDFRTRWGDRPLEDDWRWSNNTQIATNENNNNNNNNNEDTINVFSPEKENEKYSVQFYLDQLPTESKVIDSLTGDRNFANYQLGLIYKEKFKENQLAATKLETVLKANPEERLVLPSKYNLYNIYQELGSPLAEAMKQDILTNHADSRYAARLLNPDAILLNDKQGPDALYAQLFKWYKEQKYFKVITASQEYIEAFVGDPIVPKFEMLKANAIGRLQGFEAFKEALNYVALTYPNNPEGKKAEQMVAEQLPKMESKEFLTDSSISETGNWKVVFEFMTNDTGKAKKLQKKLKEILEELNYKNKVSKDIYNLENEFVVVHGFKSRDYALGFIELIEKSKKFRMNKKKFVILSQNYQTILIHKNLRDYKNEVLTQNME